LPTARESAGVLLEVWPAFAKDPTNSPRAAGGFKPIVGSVEDAIVTWVHNPKRNSAHVTKLLAYTVIEYI